MKTSMMHSDEDGDEDRKENNSRLRLRGLKIRVYKPHSGVRKNRKLVEHACPCLPNRGSEDSGDLLSYLPEDRLGLSVEFDGDSRAVIILPPHLQRRLGGYVATLMTRRKNYVRKPNEDHLPFVTLPMASDLT
ncbi:hypothetical protein J4Q44_G00186400 [Coregonus suidteri]|uniref:Uncharacterized protein n=1 Tax=Coregonus suidteri TaxID=861788 RepID=A0AAN8LR06_9TELE